MMAQNRRIAKRYARAFFHEKANREKIDILSEEIKAIVGAFKVNAESMEFFISPAATREAKLKAMGNITDKLKLSSYTSELLKLLVRKDRIAIIVEIAEELQEMSDNMNDRVRVKVTTAVEPSVDDLKLMADRISKYFGKIAAVERQIDETIIGGFILEGDGKLLDLSVKGQLSRILKKV